MNEVLNKEEGPERTDLPPASTGGETEGELWAYCPACGNPVAGKRFCPTCGRPVGRHAPTPAPVVAAPPAPTREPAPVKETSPFLDRPGLAFVAEFVPGLLGFLGVGWLYARRGLVGVGLMLGWWGLLLLAAASVLFLFGEICCFLWLPFHVSIPLISAFVVSGETRQARRRRLMGL